MGKKNFTFSNTYYTLDNGTKPYKVNIYENILSIYDNCNKKNIFDILATKIFIGKSIHNLMTEYSGDYGDEFDGNSILVETDNKKYKFIGHKIFTFDSLFTIKEFYSPIGNNEVPYPFAIDENNNIYLLLENVIILNPNLELFDDKFDPYTYYYKNYTMTKNIGIVDYDEYNPNFESFKI